MKGALIINFPVAQASGGVEQFINPPDTADFVYNARSYPSLRVLFAMVSA
jgi:hypothetical protein